MRQPAWQRCEEIFGCGAERVFGALNQCVNVQLGNEGESVDAGDGRGYALRKLGRKLAKISQDGRKTEGEEKSKSEQNGDDEDDNGNPA